MTYQHFTVEERETIQLGLWQRESISSIAKRLGRSASSVSQEIKRNLYLKRRWSPEQIAGRIKRDLGETISHEAIY